MLAKKHEKPKPKEEVKEKQKNKNVGEEKKKFKKKNYRDISHHKRKLYSVISNL